LGIGIPTLDENSNFAVVKDTYTSGNTIPLNVDLTNDLTGFEVHFYYDQFNIEYQMELMANSGIEFLRFGVSWDDFENSNRVKATASGVSGSNQITVSNATGTIVPGSYVMQSLYNGESSTTAAIPTLSVNSNWKLVKVNTVVGNTVTLNVNLTKTLSNRTINFYNTSSYEEYDFSSGGRNSTIGSFNLDQFIYLATKNGIELMPRLSGPPPWETNYDTRYLSDAPFASQDPESDDPIIGGVKMFATGNSGSTTLTVSDYNRGYLFKTNMILSGTGLPANLKITKVFQDTTNKNYKLTINSSLTSNFNGYVTGSIKNWFTNNPTNGKPVNLSSNIDRDLVFDTLADLNILNSHVCGKGGTTPKNYNNFARYTNAIINRYGTNGTFWNDTNIWGTKTSITTTATGTVSNTQYGQTLTVASTKDLVVGMTVESSEDSSTLTPSTKNNSNTSYIPEKAKICAITKNTITISKTLNKNISGKTIVAKYPRIINWQIYNEFDLCSTEYLYRGFVRQGYGQTSTDPEVGKHVQWYLTSNGNSKGKRLIGSNWPQNPRHVAQATSIDYKQSSFTNRLHMKSTYIYNSSYSWGPTVIALSEKLKKEAHSTDPDAQIVLGAIAGDSKADYVTGGLPQVDDMKACQIIFDPEIGNGINKFDKFAVNRYPSTWDSLYDIFITKILGNIKKNFYIAKKNSSGIAQPSCLPIDLLPHAVISEYGWSTNDPTTQPATWFSVTEATQASNLISLFSALKTIIKVDATGGTFTLTYKDQTTAAIAYNASANVVANNLKTLSNIGNNVTVTGENGGPFTVTFTETLANANVAELTADAKNLTGSSHQVIINSKRFVNYVNNSTGWTIDSVMYYKWASDQVLSNDRYPPYLDFLSSYGTMGNYDSQEKWRGLYKYSDTRTTESNKYAQGIIFEAKPAAQAMASRSLEREGRI
jgi:hypothetical protein